MDACPIDSTNRSRLGHTGSPGSNRRNCCHKQYATGAIAIGVPGWPELAACTASIERVRIVLMHFNSRVSCSVMAEPLLRPKTAFQIGYRLSLRHPRAGVQLLIVPLISGR